jgi:hypothetical protein
VKNLWQWLSVVGVIVALLVFVWPTPYRFEDGGMTRISRMTGKKERATTTGWTEVVPKPAGPSIEDEVKQIFERIEVASQDFDTITLKNPTDWTLVIGERAAVEFKGAGEPVVDDVTLITADRFLDTKTERTLRLRYSEPFRAKIQPGEDGTAARTITFSINTANGPEGKSFESGGLPIMRRFTGAVTPPVP